MVQLNNNPLELLYELAKIIEKGRSDKDVLEKALTLVATYMRLQRCAISAIDSSDGRIRIKAAYGLDPDQIRAGEYEPGEGVTGNVIAKGQPIYIEDISKEPMFLNRTGSRNLAREHLSFSCVPIIHHGNVIGSLWLDHSNDDPRERLKILRVVAAMLAPVLNENSIATTELPPSPLKFGRFVGNSRPIQEVYAQILQVAPSRLTVFIGGESGTGKELAARAIHEGSPRAGGPFISLNCAAIPENLVESELFGHEQGAFTGASHTRKGKFELANHGTLFLDEIGETSPAVQARLLRVLQERAFERIGGTNSIQTDVRIIVATNRDLSQMVQAGEFRLDLFYRLNVFPIMMPPLRERLEDIPELARHFLDREAKASGQDAIPISPAVHTLLMRYSWPGNIRELENVMERCFLLAGNSNIVLPEHLPQNILKNCAAQSSSGIDLKSDLAEYEKNAIRKALLATGGHIGNAAKSLGMTERVFALRLNRYGLAYKDFRAARHK